jgi:hypothetical protein
LFGWRVIKINKTIFIFKEQKKIARARVKEREMGDLYALDFDGVICDSCGESSLSAVKVLSLSLSLSIYLLNC